MVAVPATPTPHATRADLEGLPPGVKGEIIDGVLYTQPRPRSAHQDVLGSVHDDLRGPFRRGIGGSGGWWILAEPGVAVAGSPEFSPDVAGWRKTRMPKLPTTAIDLAPDWVCEVLSPSTRTYDLVVKRAFYARIGVGHLWYVDLEARAVMVSRLEQAHWIEVGVFGGDAIVSMEPFNAIEIALGPWWSSLPAPDSDGG